MKNKKVLIVDDEKDFGMLMKKFFTTTGCDLYLAHSIEDGLKILEEEKPDATVVTAHPCRDDFGLIQYDEVLWLDEARKLLELPMLDPLRVPMQDDHPGGIPLRSGMPRDQILR